MADQPTAQTLSRYEIRGTFGSGAMALVVDGWDPMIGGRVAIKTIRRDQLDSAEAEEIVERFKRGFSRCRRPSRAGFPPTRE